MRTVQLLFCLLLSNGLLSQIPVFHLQNTDIPTDDNFGSAVAISNEFCAVGANIQDENRGAVYIYKVSGSEWNLHQTLINSESTEKDWDGTCLSMTDRFLVSGAIGQTFEPSTGRAFVYELIDDTWVESGILQPTEDYEDASFGWVVNNHDNKILVAAPRYGLARGAVRLYEHINDEWVMTQEFINATNFVTGFGASIDLNDDWIAISALKSATGSEPPGLRKLIYLYKKENGLWVEHQVIETDSQSITYQTPSLAAELSDDQLIIGNYAYNSTSNADGEIEIYKLEGDTWVEKQNIIPDGFESNELGRHVALGNNYAMFTANKLPLSEFTNPHHILIYNTENPNNWRPVVDFEYENAPTASSFGFSIDINDFFGVAATQKGLNHHGDVFIYDLRRFVQNQDLLDPNSISVYPIPSVDRVTIESKDGQINAIKIFDPVGRVVYADLSKQDVQADINVSDLAPGTYWIKIKNEKGHLYKKFIKI